MYVVRRRLAGDIDTCAAVLRRVHDCDEYPHNWPADASAWLAPADMAEAWVAEMGHAVVGHVLLRRRDNETAEVARLFVAPEARGHGLGEALLTQTKQWAAEHGKRLVLEVSTSRGEGAIALYERTGWRSTGSGVADWCTPEGRPVVLRRYEFTAAGVS